VQAAHPGEAVVGTAAVHGDRSGRVRGCRVVPDARPHESVRRSPAPCVLSCHRLRPMRAPLRELSKIFVTGLLAALPLAATVVIVVWGARLIVGWVGPGSLIGNVLVS